MRTLLKTTDQAVLGGTMLSLQIVEKVEYDIDMCM